MTFIRIIALVAGLFLFSESAQAITMGRCASDRHYIYYCSSIRSGSEYGNIISRVKIADAAAFACAGFRFTPWFRLRRGINAVWATGACWYWVARQHR